MPRTVARCLRLLLPPRLHAHEQSALGRHSAAALILPVMYLACVHATVGQWSTAAHTLAIETLCVQHTAHSQGHAQLPKKRAFWRHCEWPFKVEMSPQCRLYLAPCAMWTLNDIASCYSCNILINERMLDMATQARITSMQSQARAYVTWSS